MHSGKNTGWSGRIEEPVAGPSEQTDALADTGGLRKFDLGTVPASVTPPRTWRHAAWFAVASSAATLGGLVFVTAALMGDSSVRGWVPPDMPRGGEYPPLPTGLTTSPAKAPPPAHSSGASPPRLFTGRLPGESTPGAAVPPSGAEPARTGLLRPPPHGGHTTRESSRAPSRTDEHSPGTTAPESTTPPTTSTSPPPQVLLPMSVTPMIERRTEEYFAAIDRGELRDAYALTTREESFDELASRYAGVTSIEVLGTDTRRTSAVATLRTTRDGTVTTQQRELRFTTGPNPLITSDIPA